MKRQTYSTQFPNKPSFCLYHLIIDDDELTLLSLRSLLDKYNFLVITSTSGSKALNILSNIKIDIVLLDYNMPESNGLEILKTIKAEFPFMKVIIHSALDDKHIENQLLEAGAACFIPKMNDELLINTILSYS
ncbi:MAG: response regulator [Bacteroidales bacterium]|nr:response regulator [Bacteroidales bacterium]